MTASWIAAAAIALGTAAADAQDRLRPVFRSDLAANGATTTPDGRLFLVAQPAKPGTAPQVVEIRHGEAVAHPNARWSGWTAGTDGGHSFVRVNPPCIGPDGALWAVDRGAPGIGRPLAPHGVMLVRIDPGSDEVTRVHDLGPVTAPWGFIDDVRSNGCHALLTDAGRPGLLVLDAMWIDDEGNLLLPAAQRSRTAGLNGGVDPVERPITLYQTRSGTGGGRR